MIRLTDEEIQDCWPIVMSWLHGDRDRYVAKAQLKKVMEWLLEHKETGFNKHGNVYIPPEEFEILKKEVE